MFHLLFVLLRRADYYWLYDVSVSSLRWEAGSGYRVTTGQCSVPGRRRLFRQRSQPMSWLGNAARSVITFDVWRVPKPGAPSCVHGYTVTWPLVLSCSPLCWWRSQRILMYILVTSQKNRERVIKSTITLGISKLHEVQNTMASRTRNEWRILRVLLVAVPTCNRSLINHNRRI